MTDTTQNSTTPVSAPISGRETDIIPVVSVILPTHNRPQFLKEALQSVSVQRDVCFETIIVNDGGADVSEIVAGYKDLLDLHYLNLDRNVGLPAARNAGVSCARGSYLAYLDDDDLYFPGHLAQLAEDLDQNPEIGMVYGDMLLLRQQAEKDGYRTVAQRVIALDYDPQIMLHDSFIAPSAIMHRRECFAAVGGFNENLRACYDDWDFLLRFGRRYQIARSPGLSVALRLRDDGSNMSSLSSPERQAAARLLQEQYGLHEIVPKTFWEVAETLLGRSSPQDLHKTCAS